jgi:hypothetical protein
VPLARAGESRRGRQGGRPRAGSLLDLAATRSPTDRTAVPWARRSFTAEFGMDRVGPPRCGHQVEEGAGFCYQACRHACTRRPPPASRRVAGWQSSPEGERVSWRRIRAISDLSSWTAWLDMGRRAPPRPGGWQGVGGG